MGDGDALIGKGWEKGTDGVEDDNEKELEAPDGAAIERWERVIHGGLLLACLKFGCIVSKHSFCWT